MSIRLLSATAVVLLTSAMPARGAFVARNRPYDVEHYRIEMRLDTNTGQYHNRTTIRFRPTRDLDRLVLDAEDIKTTGASLNGDPRPLPVEVTGDEIAVRFGRTLKAGDPVELIVDSEALAQPGQQGFFKAIDRSRPNRLPLYYTQFEPNGARRFFPCNDEPADKATTEVIGLVDPRYSLFSNGRLLEDSFVQEDNTRLRRVHWSLEKPQSTYLITVVVGQFETLRSRTTSLPLAIHVGPDAAEKTHFALDATERALRFFEQYYAVPYPWERYDQIGLPDFGGSMANTTQATLGEGQLVLEGDSLLARLRSQSLVAHALNHQWFGDLVTLRWWDDLWLNEGVTSFMTDLAYTDFWGQERASVDQALPTWTEYFRQEDGPRSHPLVSSAVPTPEDLFDAISDTKASRVMHMLETLIGRAALRQGMQNFLKTYAYASATSEQFFTEMEKAYGKDLKLFRDGWLSQRGYPVLTAELSWDDSQKELSMSLAGRSNHAEEKSRFIVPLPVVAHRRRLPAYDIPALLVLDTASTGLFRLKLPAEPEWVTWNDGNIALAEIETPDTPPAAWIDQALKDPTPVSRLAALRHLLQPLLDRRSTAPAELTPGVRAAVSRALGSESSAPVRAALLQLLAQSPGSFLPAEWSEVMLQQAATPRNLSSEASALDRLAIQANALACLGKFKAPEATARLRLRLLDRQLPFDLLGPAAIGWAQLGTADGIVVLQQALTLHRRRGYSFEQLLRPVFARIPDPQVLGLLEEMLAEPDLGLDVANQLFRNLTLNDRLKRSPAFPQFVEHFVLTSPDDGNLRAHLVNVLEEVKTDEAREALRHIAGKSNSQRIRTLAEGQLAKNFEPR